MGEDRRSGARCCCGDLAKNWRTWVNLKLMGQSILKRSNSPWNAVVLQSSQLIWSWTNYISNQLTASLDGLIRLSLNPTVNKTREQASQSGRSFIRHRVLKSSQLNDTMWFAVPIFRSLSGCSLFVRVEVVLRGATFHVLFTDASQLPPPFRTDNLSEVFIFTDTF